MPPSPTNRGSSSTLWMDQITLRLAIVVIGFVICYTSSKSGVRDNEIPTLNDLSQPSRAMMEKEPSLRGVVDGPLKNSMATKALIPPPPTPSTPTYQKQFPWDGIPKEEVGHVLVKKGFVDFIDDSRRLFLEKSLEEFLEVYKGRPDQTNLCGMRINHSYALFLAIRQLQPTAIIENGVNAGHSTYIMRAAAGPKAKIYPIDPLEQPICNQNKRWMDTVNSEYFTGKTFKDFTDVDWASKIKSGEIDPERTLVLLDDHLDPSTRYPTLLKYGLRHILFEDNYKVGKGATPGDKAGWLPKQLFARQDSDSQFFWKVTRRYAEFPPLVPPIVAKESSEPSKRAGGFLHASDDTKTLVAPLLRPDLDDEDKKIYENICKSLGVDPRLRDKDSYMQIMNYNQFAYMELIPLAPRLVKLWK